MRWLRERWWAEGGRRGTCGHRRSGCLCDVRFQQHYSRSTEALLDVMRLTTADTSISTLVDGVVSAAYVCCAHRASLLHAQREASPVVPDLVMLPLPCHRYRLLFADRITLFLVDPVKRELWITVSKVRAATAAEIHSRATLAALATLHSRGRCLRCWCLATGRQGHASACGEGYCRTCCTDRRSCECGRSVVGPTIQPGS